MKRVSLASGGDFLVDDADYAWVSEHRWYLQRVYVYTTIGGKNVSLHRLLLEAKKGEYVDHCDGDPRNNQRANLRLCTASQNMWNRRKRADTSSQYKGVCWVEKMGRWKAGLEQRVAGVRHQVHLGYFIDEEAAARAYDAAARERFGAFAKLNFGFEDAA